MSILRGDNFIGRMVREQRRQVFEAIAPPEFRNPTPAPEPRTKSKVENPNTRPAPMIRTGYNVGIMRPTPITFAPQTAGITPPSSSFSLGGGGSLGGALPSGGGPGAVACGAAGLPPNCSYADLLAFGAGKLLGGGGGGGGGSEPATGSNPVPGNFQASGGGPCKFPAINVGGTCIDPTAAAPGGRPFTYDAFGEATYGRYGLALTPALETRTVRRCPSGMVLGKDGLCYESLPRSHRAWNPGTKPLLTGGEMNAIRRAERAAKRVNATKKKLKAASRALAK